VRRIAGLCELPLVTAQESSRILGLPLADVEWTYAGLNHRGFIHRFEHGGRDLLAELPDRLGDRSIGGVTAAEIASVGAIPMKHFALFRPPVVAAASRVEILRRLRRTIVEELRADPTRSPPSLRERSQPWYPLAVVPMLSALTDPAPRRLVVNLPSADGVVREVHAAVSVAGILPEPVLPVSQALARRLDRSTEHERRILAATADPSLATVRAALDADPLVPPPDLDAFARRVFEDVRTREDRGERLGQAPAATTDSS
jgi:6-phospho-beta-glucosidase